MVYNWPKFQENLAIFCGERAQNLLQMGHFMVAASPQNHLKFYNLRTTNPINMKLIAIMYLHETFHLV